MGRKVDDEGERKAGGRLEVGHLQLVGRWQPLQLHHMIRFREEIILCTISQRPKL